MAKIASRGPALNIVREMDHEGWRSDLPKYCIAIFNFLPQHLVMIFLISVIFMVLFFFFKLWKAFISPRPSKKECGVV